MSDKIRASLLSLTIIAVLVFSAVGTTIVYADGDPPPDKPAAATTGSSDEASTHATGTKTHTPKEATKTHHNKNTNSAQATSAPADSNVLSAVPENTTVTVLDAHGQSRPLASQEAAQAIATTSDPIWCPGTQAPTPAANGCTDTFPSFDALLTFLSGNASYQGAGTIYVQQGAYTGGETTIDFNAYNLSNISNADLTITGGWNTSTNVVDPAATSDFTNTAIIIGSSANPWGGSLTLNNITMSFDTTFSNNASNQTMNGLTLSSQLDVNLTKVSVNNAPNDGADITAGRDVNVSGADFERNQTTGMLVKAGRNVNVGDSSFSNPVNGRRQETGLDITSGASTSLFNVLANDNRVAGANINSTGAVTIGNSVFSGTKLIQGATFLGYGLQVVTPDIISIDTVTANDNFLWGASLQAGGNIAVNNSIFNANTTASTGFIDDTGLVIKGGSNVALNSVTANDNRLFGAVIDATGTVSINNSTFNNNRGTTTTGGVTEFHGHGLKVTSLATINLNNVTASNNMLFGAQLNAGGDVNIANSTFSDCTTCTPSAALGIGLDVVSTGNTALLNVILDSNQTFGATIQAGGDVFLTTVTATNNGADGVAVQTACTHLSGGTYSGNGQYGLNLGSSALDLDAANAPTFSGNGAGDIFPTNPPTCTLVLGGNTAGGPAAGMATGGTTGGTTVLASSSSFGNLTFKSFLSSANALSSFAGRYAYVFSNSGIQIVVFTPSLDEIAMEGTYRAY
ncbi:MAG TPA: right-handed parallel beta-helix repeat-containing protein [Anaerolineales bacterium]|nr:right-handed parallel beta-helix repeat-containing protein [Anaerolineales bacterium]